MKITKIRGKNIRSLYGQFEIDFEAPPFDRLGLFAITGPTGSGKSTILDVICLALYGVCPRLENQRKNAAMINHLVGSDPRTAISRGTSNGFAEVVFESNGNRYRARWEVHRSGKKSSDFTKPIRELIDETTGHTLAVQSKEFNHQMEIRSRLTYHQFSRSVLLAQGDFAAFLKASPDERSALLEAITGLDIYTRLSIEAHRQGLQIETDLKDLESQLQRINPPSEQEINELQTQIRLIEERKTQLNLMDSQYQTYLRWYHQEQELNEKFSQAEKHYHIIKEKYDQAEPKRKQLQQALKAFAIRSEIQYVEKTANILQKTIKEQSDAFEAVKKASDAYTSAKNHLKTVTDQFENEKHRQESIRPDIDRARQLDIQIEEASKRLKEKKTAFTSILKKYTLSANELKSLQDQVEQLNNHLSSEKQWLMEHQTIENLAREWQYYHSLLLQYETVHVQKKDLEKKQQTYQSDLITSRKKTELLDQSVRKEKELMDQLAGLLKEKRQILNDLEQAYPDDTLQTHLNLYTKGLFIINQLMDWDQQRQMLEKQVAKNSSEKHQLETSLQNIETEIITIDKDRTHIRIRLDEAKQSLELILRVLSCEELRSQLEPGKPCMVCGSTVHPYLTNDMPDRKIQMQEHARVQELESQLQETESAYVAKTSQKIRLEERITALNQSITNDRQKLDQIRIETQTAYQNFTELFNQLVLKDGSSIEVDRTPLKDISNKLADEILHIENIQKKKKELSDILLQKGKEYETLQSKFQQIHEQFTSARHHCDMLEKDIMETTSQLTTIENKKQSLLEQLAKPFDQISAVWESECKKDPASFRKSIEKQVISFNLHLDNQMKLQKQLTELIPKLTQSQGMMTELESLRAEAKDTVESATSELNALKDHRKTILNGRLVSDVIRELDQKLEQLDKEMKQAEKIEKDAVLRLTQAESKANHIKASMNQAVTEHEQAQVKLKDALVLHQLELEQAINFHKKGEIFIQQLQRELTDLDNELSRSSLALAQRKSDLDNFRSSTQHPELSKPELDQQITWIADEKKKIDIELTDMLATQREFQKRLEESLRVKKQLNDLKEKGKWRQQLKEVIGHHAGDKFRKFAQTVTLKHLVALANDQLLRLASRYQLTIPENSQNLEIAVIDQDQASEIRQISTLSGGETFLVSLALSLALSKLSSHQTKIQTLFVDEGFGLLDPEALDSAIATLEAIQSEGKLIGLISHIPMIQERIACQIRVISEGAGRSRLEVWTG